MSLHLYLIVFFAIFLSSCSKSLYNKLYNDNPGFYSYVIGDVKTNKIKNQHLAEIYTTPASCQKVITALVALKSLGAEYSYHTKLFISKKGNKIQDAAIVFAGDPTFDSSKLRQLLAPLENTTIRSHLILDASIFKTPPHSPNIMLYDIGRQYSSPVSAMNIDHNLILINVEATSISDLASISNDMDIKIINKVTTSALPSLINLSWQGEEIVASGVININDSLIKLKLSPKEIEPYILYKVKAALKSLNVKAKIKITHDAVPIENNFKLSDEIKSLPIKEIIKPALKASDNLIFDSLYLTILKNNSSQEINDWDQGDEVMKELIAKYFNINAQDAKFVDGSGLSRYNRIQPIMLFDVLQQNFENKDFIDALAKPGEIDSTLVIHTLLPNTILAKNGAMSGISCLCGYNVHSKSRATAFVIIANSFSSKPKPISEVIDSFIAQQTSAQN
jgi:D-alanyl-D-alanine carboxypeptidase/D-alanyl-D-alanine-endopeptidase (penicillin-binding protein 4)